MIKAKICKDSFVNEKLRAYYSDILYQVHFNKDPGFVYLLFEHKSHPDPQIHLQLLSYMLQSWQLRNKQIAGPKLPAVVPLVLYHGPRKWKIPLEFLDMLAGPTDVLAPYIPNFQYLLYDLSRYDDSQFKGTLRGRITLLLFKHIFDPDIMDRLPGILALLKDFPDQNDFSRFFELLVYYLMGALENVGVADIRSAVSRGLSEEKGELVMSLAERLHNEGIQKGILQGKELGMAQGKELGMAQGKKQGIIQGRELGIIQGKKQGITLGLDMGLSLAQESIELAMQIKFGESEKWQLMMQQIRQIKDIDRLKALKEKIKTAQTLDELIPAVLN